MSDIMEKVRWIIACEFGETGNPAVLRCLNRLEAVITPLLQPEPPKGQRVEEVRKIIFDSDKADNLTYKQIAEQIVATEPSAMSRGEMVKVVAERLEVVGWNDAAKNLRLDAPLQPLVTHRAIRLGATFAIEALCNQIPASEAAQLKEEAEVWKKKYEWCKEYCVMPDSLPAKGSDRLDKVIAVVNKWLDATE